jgi:hypothetical protein
MKKKKEKKEKIDPRYPVILGQEDMSDFHKNPPEWAKKKVEDANKLLEESPIPDWILKK